MANRFKVYTRYTFKLIYDAFVVCACVLLFGEHTKIKKASEGKKNTCYESFSLFNIFIWFVCLCLHVSTQFFSSNPCSFLYWNYGFRSHTYVAANKMRSHAKKEAVIFFLIYSIMIYNVCYGMWLLPKLKLISIVLKKWRQRSNE